MRPFLQPARRTCAACERPARPSALVCDYCGEDLPHRRSRLIFRVAMGCTALVSTLAFAVVRGWVPFPAKLTLPGSALVALGSGIALLPPVLRGVAGATRRDRLWQAVPRYFGGIALALLTGVAALTAGASQPWTLIDAATAAVTALTLLAAPLALDLPWHKLVAGMLLAAGLLLSR